MAGKVRFYRGEQGTSLPATRQNGAIFIIERFGSDSDGYSVGDMYVDMDNGNRLHIIPDKEIITYNPQTMSNIQSKLGQTYLFQETNPRKIGIAVGDGNAYISDLKVYDYDTITGVIKNKVNAYLGTEYLTQNQLNKDKGSTTNKPLSDNFPKKTIDGKEVIDNQALAETLVLSREL